MIAKWVLIYNLTPNRNIHNELVFKYGNLWVNFKKNLIFYFTICICEINSKTYTAKLFSFLRPPSHLQDHSLLFGTNFLSPKRVFLTYKNVCITVTNMSCLLLKLLEAYSMIPLKKWALLWPCCCYVHACCGVGQVARTKLSKYNL